MIRSHLIEFIVPAQVTGDIGLLESLKVVKAFRKPEGAGDVNYLDWWVVGPQTLHVGLFRFGHLEPKL